MSLESQFKSKILLEKIEPLTVIKNEPEIGMDEDIISADIKDEMDIEYHLLSEDLIKSEPIPNLLKSEHLESVETQIFIQTENTPFIKTKFEKSGKTRDTKDGNLISGSNHKKRKAKMDNCRLKYHCNKCKYKTSWRSDLKVHKLLHLEPEKIPYLYCYHCSYKSIRKNNLKGHILNHFKNEEVPFHCYICDFVTSKRNLIFKHFKKHPEHCSKWNETEYKNQVEAYFKQRIRYNYYYCKKCEFRTDQEAKLKLHELSHEAERDDQHLKYQCDKCQYKTFRLRCFKVHKLLHLEPEKIPYFYCYHCSHKSNRKSNLKNHILGHFINEEVPFHCYICDFVTKNRYLILKHFKKHPEHIRKYELTQESEMDDQYLEYECDKCTYKTFRKESLKKHKLMHLKSEEIQWFYCYHCLHKSKRKSNLKNHILTHFKKYPEHVSKCYKTDGEIDLLKLTPEIKKRYELIQKSEVKMDDQYLKYECDKCTYKTSRSRNFENHKLIHLKPEEIQWFYCYHCSYKAKQKSYLKKHILRHFTNEVVTFHCYMCNFITLKRKSITEHIKKHSKVQVKSKINQRP